MFSALLQALVLKLPASKSVPDVEDLEFQMRKIYANLIPLPKDPKSIVMEYLEMVIMSSICEIGGADTDYTINLLDSTQLTIYAYENSPPDIIVGPYQIQIHNNLFSHMILRACIGVEEHAKISIRHDDPSLIKEFIVKFSPNAMKICYEPSKEHILDFAKAKSDP